MADTNEKKYLDLAGLTDYDTRIKALIKDGNSKLEVRVAQNETDIDALENQVNTLVGDDANKSVRTIANEELTKQLIPEDAKESLDTLQEIAAWIQNHPDDASAGSATQPVYFSSGKPVACSYTIAKSVPSNAVFTDTNTWTALKGSTTSAAGTAGYVPAPAAGAATRYLRCDGTWTVPPDTNTTYSAATTSAAGLMSAADKTKLDGIATGANAYTLPTATSSVLGGVKIGSNITVSSGTISLTKANVTSALGYTPPTTNTTYSVATTSANGLMSSTDKSKLDNLSILTMNTL